MPDIQYFLGGNTSAGFTSLYHQLSDPERMRAVYIIKSGPGSGKSTLMRRVERRAKEAGLDTEQVLCSGDPDSLDAVILPRLGAAIVDGTAPQGAVPLVHEGRRQVWGTARLPVHHFFIDFPPVFPYADIRFHQRRQALWRSPSRNGSA